MQEMSSESMSVCVTKGGGIVLIVLNLLYNTRVVSRFPSSRFCP